MANTFRDKGGRTGLGDRRYVRYCAAFDWVQHCLEAGYYLEAITVLDSLIGERLSSRLGYLKGEEVRASLSIGMLCSELLGSTPDGGREREAEFRSAIDELRSWVHQRNEAVHATAKVFRADTSNKDFSAIIDAHEQTALEGVRLLQKFDEVDTYSRERVGKIPASYPNAFFPEKRRSGGTPVT